MIVQLNILLIAIMKIYNVKKMLEKIETIRKENVFAQFHDTDDTVVWFDIKSAIINDNRKTVTFVMSNPLKK